MIVPKKIGITHIVNGILVISGIVFSILCLLSILEKGNLEEDYKRKVSERKNAYLYSKKDFTRYREKLEDEFSKLSAVEMQKLVRYKSSRELPSPTLDNKKLAEQNLETLQTTRADHEKDLIGADNLALTNPNDPNFELAVQQNIRNYALKMRRIAQNPDGKSETNDTVVLDSDYVRDFGFSNYVSQTKTSNIWELAYTLDKQRAILEYLVGELLGCKIHRLISVKRENIETKYDPNISIAGADVFYLDPLMSARVEGAINTFAFQLEFSGYTESLRLFFNKLSEFKLPVVVRDVKVKREERRDEEEEAVEMEELPPAQDSPFPGSSPFPSPGPDGSPPSQPVPVKKAQKPVVDKNTSTFALVIEFVELAKTEDLSEEEDSDDN